MKSSDLFIAVTTAHSGVLVCVATAAQPAETKDADVLVTQSERMNSLTRTHGSATVSSTISSDFSGFAGSTANAEALATGLRSGTAITLTSTDAKGVTTATTFTPPTGRMGFGNVFISRALARQQLAGLGTPIRARNRSRRPSWAGK